MYKNETEGEGESDGEGESSDTIDYLLEETDIPYDEEDMSLKENQAVQLMQTAAVFLIIWLVPMNHRLNFDCLLKPGLQKFNIKEFFKIIIALRLSKF